MVIDGTKQKRLFYTRGLILHINLGSDQLRAHSLTMKAFWTVQMMYNFEEMLLCDPSVLL